MVYKARGNAEPCRREKQTNGSCSCANAFVIHDGYCFLTRVSFVAFRKGSECLHLTLTSSCYSTLCAYSSFPTFAALQLPISFVYLLSTFFSRIHSSLFSTDENTSILFSLPFDYTIRRIRRNFLSFITFLYFEFILQHLF